MTIVFGPDSDWSRAVRGTPLPTGMTVGLAPGATPEAISSPAAYGCDTMRAELSRTSARSAERHRARSQKRLGDIVRGGQYSCAVTDTGRPSRRQCASHETSAPKSGRRKAWGKYCTAIPRA